MEVEERFGTRQLVRWDLIATRLMEMDGARRITGGIIPFPARNKDAVLEALQEEYVRFRAVRSRATKEEFLKEKGEPLYGLARRSLDAPLPSLVTSDGDPVAFCRARYHIRQPEGLAGKIESIPGMEAGEGPKPFFRWVEPLTEGEGPVPDVGAQPAGSGESLVFTSILGSSRSLGSIEISEDRLMLECMSEARLARGRALLEDHLPGAIIHRADTVQDPWQAMTELIRQIEHGQIMQQREKGFAYDTAWLWEELGLDPDRD